MKTVYCKFCGKQTPKAYAMMSITEQRKKLGCKFTHHPNHADCKKCRDNMFTWSCSVCAMENCESTYSNYLYVLSSILNYDIPYNARLNGIEYENIIITYAQLAKSKASEKLPCVIYIEFYDKNGRYSYSVDNGSESDYLYPAIALIDNVILSNSNNIFVKKGLTLFHELELPHNIIDAKITKENDSFVINGIYNNVNFSLYIPFLQYGTSLDIHLYCNNYDIVNELDQSFGHMTDNMLTVATYNYPYYSITVDVDRLCLCGPCYEKNKFTNIPNDVYINTDYNDLYCDVCNEQIEVCND